MSGERKKDDSDRWYMKFFKSTERNSILSSKEPSDIAERSSISSATESVQINESKCSATSSPVDDHSFSVIATPTICINLINSGFQSRLVHHNFIIPDKS